MSKTDFRDKKLPDEQGTIVTAELMGRLNNQVPTGEDFDGSAPPLFGTDTGIANAYEIDLVFGKKVEDGTNTSVSTGKLVDTGATFVTSGAAVGDTVLNVSDLASAKVTAVDSETQLSIDTDIFTATGEKYAVGPHIFQAPQALAEGMELSFKTINANTGASTLSVNGLAPVPLMKQGDVYLSAWDIRKGQVVKAVFDGTSFQMLNPNEVLSMGELIVSNWTVRYTPARYLYGIAWNGSLFCAVGLDDATDAYILTSPDGITWTERSNPKAADLQAIAWNGSVFCAVGYQDGTDAYIVTSPDGTTWTERSNPQNLDLLDIAWNGSVFCAVGPSDGTDAYIVTSPDGITWTERSNPQDAQLNGITWNGSVFCAVGPSDGTDTYIVTSPDGITWTERNSPNNYALIDVAWNGSVFCAVGGGPHAPFVNNILTSADGVTWTERISPTVFSQGIAWNGYVFCAVGMIGIGGEHNIITSPDGITWTERNTPDLSPLYDVVWNGSMFCAVGQGTIMTSLSL